MPIVRYLASRIAVMYRGEIVEIGPTETITSHAQNPYTASLVAATPTIAPA
jgi:peptide/nickel transport system ATP-binding protein